MIKKVWNFMIIIIILLAVVLILLLMSNNSLSESLENSANQEVNQSSSD